MNTQQEINNVDTTEEYKRTLNAIQENGEEEVKKGHRRSKNDTEGRTFKCKICGKSYLSYPALYTHSKQKHNTSNSSGRGRGRPKKECCEVYYLIFNSI